MIETMITSSVLILAICLIRFLLKGKINPRIQYALWGLVALRLLGGVFYPIGNWLSGFQSHISVMNAADRFKERVIVGTPMEPLADNLVSGHVYTFENANHVALKAAGIDWQLWIMAVWCIGFAALVGWMTFVNMKFYRMLKEQRVVYTGPLPAFVTKPVYVVPNLTSPCYFGLYGDEAIYLPQQMADSEAKVRHSLAHEMGHVKQGDLWWGSLRCGLLCMFWINPLVWVAAVLSKRDCELSCDEIAVGFLGEQERFSYGRTLVDVISRKGETVSLFSTATTMAEGHKAIKERIQVLAKNPRRTVPMVISIGCIALVLAACTFTSSIESGESEGNQTVSPRDETLLAEDQKISAATELILEELGQWGNYYRLRLSGIRQSSDEYDIELTVYEDAETTTLLGDGKSQHGHAYFLQEDGSVILEFWNTENAGSVLIELITPSGETIADTRYETKNQEIYKTYSLHQEIKGVGDTSITLVSAEEYPNALCLTLRGSSDSAHVKFLNQNTTLLMLEDLAESDGWISPVQGSNRTGEWRLMYLFEENIYPMSKIEALVCVRNTDQSEYIVNELEYHQRQVKNSPEKNSSETEMIIEEIGQWGNYYQLRLTGIDWESGKNSIYLAMYEDAAASTMIGDGSPQQSYGYSENPDGSVSVDFWNTENAGAVRVIMTDDDGTMIAETLYETKNQEPYETYSFSKELDGMGGTSATLVSAEEYPNALCLTLRGSSESVLMDFYEQNVVLLKPEDVTDSQEWIGPTLSSRQENEWKLMYLFQDEIYPMSKIDSLTCGIGGKRSEYIVNNLE